MEHLKAPSHPPPTDSSPNLSLEAAKCGKILLGCYRTGDANDPDIYVRSVAAVLSEYPLEVMKAVCDPRFGLPAKSKWLPTIFEIKDACEAAMAPIDRRRREEQAAEERRLMVSAPLVPRPTYEQMKDKHGENWGIRDPKGDKQSVAARTLDDLCREVGIPREDFEAINDKAVKTLVASGQPLPRQVR